MQNHFPPLGIDVIVYVKYLMYRFIFVCVSLVGHKWHPRKGGNQFKNFTLDKWETSRISNDNFVFRSWPIKNYLQNRI